MMAPRFRPYPETKDSGIEWLGEIPEDWGVVPFKTVLARNDSGVWGDDPDGVSDRLVLRSTEQDVNGSWSIDNPAPRKLSERERTEALLIEGDLVVTKSSGSQLHIGKTSYVDEGVASLRACFSNFMQRLRLKSGNDPRLYWHLMNSPVCRQQFVFLSTTTTGLGNLNAGIIGAVWVPVASLGEQQAIADFLDRETAKIDALVEKKERLIELLQEKRTALITHAVTKGLDPDVPMKDSGIEWLGQIPVHWEVKRLKHLTPDSRPIMYGIVLPGPDVAEGVPIVKSGDIHARRLNLESLCKTTKGIEAGYERSRLRGDDIVYSIRGSIGDCDLVPDELEGANLTQDAARVSPRLGVRPRWLLYMLRSQYVFGRLEAGALGATIRGINIWDLKRVQIPVPDEVEQAAVAGFLDRETAKIDSLIAKVREAIERLKEYRTALISAAVTGKIDVREAVR